MECRPVYEEPYSVEPASFSLVLSFAIKRKNKHRWAVRTMVASPWRALPLEIPLDVAIGDRVGRNFFGRRSFHLFDGKKVEPKSRHDQSSCAAFHAGRRHSPGGLSPR